MPSLGHFVLHSRFVPDLTAGTYHLTGTEDVVGGGPTQPYDGYIRVNSPRYRMPPDQILSVFPPANSEGAYEARLPQVVIKRRTLPWERNPFPGQAPDTKVPWLALVVIAEGEGSLSAEVPVAECVTPGRSLGGAVDVPTGVYLSVPSATVSKVFPCQQDLELLVHCREVDIDDTEQAMGDDDGFLAVVMANRLPQFDRVNCTPVRYMACLINLEQQLDVLPPPSTPVHHFDADAAVYDARAVLNGGVSYHPDQYVMGTGRFVGTSPGGLVTNAGADAQTGPNGTGAASEFVRPQVDTPVSGGTVKASGWRTTPSDIERLAVTASNEDAGRIVRDAMSAAFRFPIEQLTPTSYRFPVLSYWSFTVTGAGSFQTLMQGLDVGMLATLPADPAAAARADCLPPPGGTAPPPAPLPRPPLEVAETGHVGLGHLTRRGDSVRAWYRGPLGPYLTRRDTPDEAGRLPMAHVSDQLRRVVPDGREDLALAAAFEIGRLLALSQPSVIAAFMRWRREQFGAARAAALGNKAVDGVGIFTDIFASAALADLGALVGRSIILNAAQDVTALAPMRSPVDPGRPLAFLSGDLDQVIATGFGLSLDAIVKQSGRLGVVGAVNVNAAPVVAPAEQIDPSGVANLRAGLTQAVDQLARGTFEKGPHTGGPPRGKRAPGAGARRAGAGTKPVRDALDELLDQAAVRREGEAR